MVLPTQPHPARKASHRDQAALRSNHLDPLAWPLSPLYLTVQKISSSGLIYYFSQISSVLFHCSLPSIKEHNSISMSKLINCWMKAEMRICSNCLCILRKILHSHYMEMKISIPLLQLNFRTWIELKNVIRKIDTVLKPFNLIWSLYLVKFFVTLMTVALPTWRVVYI